MADDVGLVKGFVDADAARRALARCLRSGSIVARRGEGGELRFLLGPAADHPSLELIDGEEAAREVER